jgi:uncharacterized phage protein gp47/JayE
MQLSLQSFATAVQNSAAAVQGACATLLDLTVGSVLRAVLEANASLMLWMQWVALQVLQTTRLSTSQGLDVDSFLADFDLTRLPSVAATGAVTFGRFSAGFAALVTPYSATDGSGTAVKTLDGTQTFGVTIDTTNSAWNVAQGGYLIPIGTASVTVPVAALVAGSAGNVQAGTIGLISSALSGVDTVTNTLAFTNGIDAESDPAARARFIGYINSRARGTEAAIGYAISSVQQGVTYQLVANVDTTGAFLAGNFVAYVDDGTGSPSDSLLAAVSAAIDAVRGFTISYNVQPPTVIAANVVMTIVAAAGYTSANLVGAVSTALTTFIDALPMGSALPYSRLAQVAYSVAGVANVTGVSLDSGTSDIGGSQGQVVRVGALTINPG